MKDEEEQTRRVQTAVTLTGLSLGLRSSESSVVEGKMWLMVNARVFLAKELKDPFRCFEVGFYGKALPYTENVDRGCVVSSCSQARNNLEAWTRSSMESRSVVIGVKSLLLWARI